jgi:hypothetical protein
MRTSTKWNKFVFMDRSGLLFCTRISYHVSHVHAAGTHSNMCAKFCSWTLACHQMQYCYSIRALCARSTLFSHSPTCMCLGFPISKENGNKNVISREFPGFREIGFFFMNSGKRHKTRKCLIF